MGIKWRKVLSEKGRKNNEKADRYAARARHGVRTVRLRQQHCSCG